jgi:hypothetical protein
VNIHTIRVLHFISRTFDRNNLRIMALSESQSQTLLNWVKMINPNYACPCCGKSEFDAGNLMATPTFENGAITMGQETIPMVQLICKSCFHIDLFASVPLGL